MATAHSAAGDEDFYALLGVSRHASDDELKRAYRQLARELHPDANPGDKDAEDRFKRITVAYETLRDPERRRRYDLYGLEGLRAGAGPGDPFAGFGGLGDIFDAFFGGAPFGGTSARRRGGAVRGADVEVRVTLEFEEAVFGAQKEVSIDLPVPCEQCDATGSADGRPPIACVQCGGTGELRQVRQSILGQMVTARPCPRCGGEGLVVADPCPACRGEGRVADERSFLVDVPAGVDTGTTLRLSGRGAVGPRGGPAGDLYVHLDVRSHPRFERHGTDLVHELHIAATQAALGAQLSFATLDGDEELTIPQGTQTGRVFRLRGRGVPHLGGRGRGDLLLHAVVDTPDDLTPAQEELLRKLAAERGEDVAGPDTGLLSKIRSAFK